MLDADMSARYWKYLVQRYSKKEKTLKIVLAIMSSVTIMTLICKRLTHGLTLRKKKKKLGAVER